MLSAETRSVETSPDPDSIERAGARNCMIGDDLGGLRVTWAELLVEAVDLVGVPDDVTFAVRTVRDGAITDSRLARGAVLEGNERANEAIPRRVEDASVLVIGGYHDRDGLQTGRSAIRSRWTWNRRTRWPIPRHCGSSVGTASSNVSTRSASRPIATRTSRSARIPTSRAMTGPVAVRR